MDIYVNCTVCIGTCDQSPPLLLQVHDDHEAVYCESGCEQWYHRDCTGMSRPAYNLLTAEESAEWACDTCVGSKAVPTIKMVSRN